MERYFTRNNTYVGATTGNVNAGAQVAATTEAGKYVLTFPAGTVTASTFTIRATPQFTDSKCGYLEITQTGSKSSEISGSCW